MPNRHVSIRPTAEQLLLVVDFFKSLRPIILRRGSALQRRGTVERLWLTSQGEVLNGKVQGSFLYTQEIWLTATGLENGVCTCPDGVGTCKHIVAALVSYSKGWQGPGEDLHGKDDDYDPDLDIREEDEDEDDPEDARDGEGGTSRRSRAAAARTNSSRPQALPEIPTAAAAKSRPSQPKPEPRDDHSTLAHFLEQKLKVKLTASEKKRTALIDTVYQKNTPNVTAGIFLEIAGMPTSYHYYYGSSVTVWPSHRPPRNIAEAWYYFAYAMRDSPLVRQDSFLLRLAPWPEVERLIAPWKREEAVKEWQEQLSSFNQTPELPPAAPPDFRLVLDEGGARIQIRPGHSSIWAPAKVTVLRSHAKVAWSTYHTSGDVTLDDDAIRFLRATCPREHYGSKIYLEKNTPQFISALNILLRSTASGGAVVAEGGQPLTPATAPAFWSLEGPLFPAPDSSSPDAPDVLAGDYTLALKQADGSTFPGILAILPGHPNLVLTPNSCHPLPGPPLNNSRIRPGAVIPVAALESPAGLATLDRLRVPLPERIDRRVRTVKPAITVRCQLKEGGGTELFQVQAIASTDGLFPDETWKSGAWKLRASGKFPRFESATTGTLTRLDLSLQSATSEWLHLAGLSAPAYDSNDYWMVRHLSRQTVAAFPEEFLHWLSLRPEGITVELDSTLASLRDHGKVTGAFNIELEETGIDWFDLTLNLQLSDIELTQKEIDLLLRHTGAWVRLPNRGWRRLDFTVTEEHQQQLADLGLSAADLHSPEKQRLHTLQLAHPSSASLLPAERAAEVQRRAADLRTAVAPDLPAGITATLRPYQLDGFHFLAYLSTNRFGGILADDMGLGKTLQALAWLAWLHETGQAGNQPILVVCPKSVQDNWTAEAAKFYPALPLRQWTPANTGDLSGIESLPPPDKKSRNARTPAGSKAKSAAPATSSPPLLVIINYTQLRLNAEALTAIPWSAVILDEAQYIKNPSSLTARTAFGLMAGHRLALSGTPIENRLLDLWSIMAFSMPGILGNRTHFAKTFGGKDDPLARRRLSARVRPFVLRRTKKEVAADLPDRIEEDLICTLEGPQKEQYLAELKLARTTLLKAKTSAQLDKLRFNILTSLLRLRQICCHPSLTGKGQPADESAKLNTLLELLEPLIDEGHKVLIFSQFVEMLHLIGSQLTKRDWPHLTLTGATEDRGALVRKFQETEGACLFLISLKAGGSGLNLTAASYVVLFDPWWNPAVENQAIDRTHRIGQVNKVIAYRLITRDTIEEKIRHLQKSKSALAADILGEETFAKALTLDDFQFLLNP